MRAHSQAILWTALCGLVSCRYDGEEITVYPISCSKPYIHSTCPDLLIPLNRTTNRVFVEKQNVIYWMPDFNDNPPSRLEKCAVRDVRNWSCEYPDSSGKVSMASGHLIEEQSNADNMSSLPQVQYVSQIEWWRLQFGL